MIFSEDKRMVCYLSASLCYEKNSFKPVLSQRFPVCQGCLTRNKSGLTPKDVSSEP